MSLGSLSVRPKPDGSVTVQQNETSYGLPNLMVDGFQNVKSGLRGTHPLEFTEKNWEQNQQQMDMKVLRNTQGIHAPLKIHMELNMAKQMKRFPCLPSSNLMLNTLTGRLDTIDFDDILNDPMESEVMGEPHAMVERRMGLL